uniref:Cytochrome P450 monooxygenase orf5 n=1 Tax=Eupenicillium brefeldianum TaxID=1131482 RepID=BREF5_EUPBR|nr:RecName: Full=Cytochrome P450 monooxygenase orf5; AltName: Full=Brefeldin A biosynthesis cluster protein orf5 [Penicillium brefeldianum]AIA58897.1 putative cytochrome P450 [Penicillium brefeldianum]
MANDVSGLGPTAFVRLLAFHLIGLFVSITVYRLFFHNLSGFRGPFIARLSSFYLAWLSAKRLHLHDEIDDLHSLYGDYVRTGPRELSIIDPQCVQVIYGSQTKCIKGPIYTLLDPRTNLSSTRDKTEHAKRRRAWDRGFSTTALHTYEPMVQELTEELMTIIDELSENPINITEWVDKYAFEVMGQLTFGKPFNMLKERKEAYFLELIRQDMNAIGYLLNLPWLSYLFLRTPGLNQNHLNFWRWIENEFAQRIARGQRRPDVFNWLHQAYLQGPQTKSDTLKLHGDGYLVIVAGSDTTASTITHLLFYLACNKALTQKLQAQLDALEGLTDESLRDVELLDACINETLRLRPAVPAGVQRETPKEGIYIGNRYIPGDTIVKVPMYTLFRDPRSFEQPNEFIPERFTTRPELVKDKSVFIPFLTGSYACVGRRLALMEVRRAVAAILCRYDIALAPGQNEEGFLDGKIDAFTLVAAPLSLKFTRRHQQKQ